MAGLSASWASQQGWPRAVQRNDDHIFVSTRIDVCVSIASCGMARLVWHLTFGYNGCKGGKVMRSSRDG